MKSKTPSLDWLILAFALVGLVLMLLPSLFGITQIGGIYLDVNYIAVGIVIMYTLLTGIKLFKTSNQKLGLYMIFFSILMLVMVGVSLGTLTRLQWPLPGNPQ